MEKILARLEKGYRVETARGVNAQELFDFFKTAYSDQFNAADYLDEDKVLRRWKWANLENPHIDKDIFPAWICRDKKNGRIVGHFAVTPISLKFQNTSYPAVWGRDLVILPKYRKLGIGPLLIDSTLKNAGSALAIFLIAGLNDDVYTIYKKLKFTDLEYIPLYVRFQSIENIVKLKIRKPFPALILGAVGNACLKIFYILAYMRTFSYARNREICISEIKSFDNSFDGLWDKASHSFPIIVMRDQKSLNWRFVNQPYRSYSMFKAEKDGELKGYIVLREGKIRGLNTGVISDLFAEPNDKATIGTLLNFAVRYFSKKADIDLLRCNILHGSFAEMLKRFGFINLPSSSHFMFINVKEGLDKNFAAKAKNWLITYADSDLDFY